MSRNSKTKRDAKKKAHSKKQRAISLSPRQLQEEAQALLDSSKLTVPKEIYDDIKAFCLSISPSEPFFLDVNPESWCRQSCCDLNVKEQIKLDGGKIVCGYKIWYHEPRYIEAERHAIWEKDGSYRDITFNSDGERRILFLPDVPDKQGALEVNKPRIRWAKDRMTKLLVRAQEAAEAKITMQQMSNEQSWNTMPTYDEWLQGKRMPNVIPVFNS